MGIGINGFLVPHRLLDGGITGIALIIHYYFDYPTGLCMFLISLPLSIYAWYRERDYFYNSFLGLIVAAAFIDWLAPIRTQIVLPVFPSVIIGGTLIGCAVGIMLRFQTSTGGTDLLAHFISKSFSINIGIIILLIDGLITAAAYGILGVQVFLFSCLTIAVIGLVTSLITRPVGRGA